MNQNTRIDCKNKIFKFKYDLISIEIVLLTKKSSMNYLMLFLILFLYF